MSKELIENCVIYDETKECYEELSTLLAEVSLEKTSIQVGILLRSKSI